MKYIIGVSLAFILSCTASHSHISVPSDKNLEPLYVINGNVVPYLVKSQFDSTIMVPASKSFDPQKVDDIKILTGESAIRSYGSAAKNEVIIVTLKKNGTN